MRIYKCILALLSVFAIQYAGISAASADDWGYPDRIYNPNWTYFDWCTQQGGIYRKSAHGYSGCAFHK
jgi:hypothetical protein